MATTATYTDRIYKQRVDTLRELLMELPEFCFAISQPSSRQPCC